MTSIQLDGVTVAFSEVTVLDNITLRVEDQELLVVIGPSGSGKSTLLRAVGGLDAVASGEVRFDDIDVTDLSPARRDIAMVFQDNALIPYKSVRKNVAFPLEVHRVGRDEIDQRVLAETRTLAIDRFLERFPKELSAGHQQLVQAARALVRRPSVFLLDEPLASMDEANRRMMREEIVLLQRGYGVTTLYATNDQEEAMALADRIAVIHDGRLRQVGPPDEVYRRPVDTFVAGFVGSPPMSLIRGELREHEVRLKTEALPIGPQATRGPVTVGVRPHHWERIPTAGLQGVVTFVENHGDHAFAHIDLDGEEVTMRVGADGPSVGESIEIWTRRFHVFDRSGRAIAHISPQ
ncbi:MAG: ABC transporter ATP-binding protein [Actinomycetota bacterium]